MPNSILWLLLVVIWLFVLVPMIVKGRAPVRRSTDAVKQTRVVHKGGRTLQERRQRSAARHPSDPDYVSRAADVDDHDDSDVDADELVEADVTAAEAVGGELDNAAPRNTRDDDEVFEVEATDGARIADPAVDETEYQVVDGALDPADEFDVDTVVTADADEVDEVDAADSVVAADDAAADDAAHDRSVNGTADDSAANDTADDSAADTDEDLTADETVERRPNRVRRFDADADATRAIARAKGRQRTLLLLVALTLALVVVGLVVGFLGWVAAACAAAIAVLYLTYLRRTVKAEQRLRQQRMARAARARRAAAEREHARRANPPRLRRPGAIVLEIDDEDPAFDHLPTYSRARAEAPRYQRAAGE